MKNTIFLSFFLLIATSQLFGQVWRNKPEKVKLQDMLWRDNCVLTDKASGYYYMVGPAGKSVMSYRSKDLINWESPTVIFTIPDKFWGDIELVSIWAPELHFYKGKYYLFLTIDTKNMFAEQWPNWRPRVTRGSQVLVSDSPAGPFKAFTNHSTLPVEMMTLDATLWEEDGKSYIVYAHEWVQISNGTIEYLELTPDLSGTIGEPKLMFRGSDAPWGRISPTEGNFVTDGPYLRKSKTGQLMMVWSSFSHTGYTTGVAFSESGKLAGPWRQQKESLYSTDGGHSMLFETFDGKLMMVLHSPNNRESRPHIFEMEDTGSSLRVVKEIK